MSDKLSAILCGMLVVGIIAIAVFMSMSGHTTASGNAQCKSIGGVFDGQECWYNGEKVDVNEYVEEWKHD